MTALVLVLAAAPNPPVPPLATQFPVLELNHVGLPFPPTEPAPPAVPPVPMETVYGPLGDARYPTE